MAPDEIDPAIDEADRHRAVYNEALSRGDRAAAERAFGAEYEALRRAYPSAAGSREAPESAAIEGNGPPAGEAIALSLAAIDVDRHDAVREVIDTYAADEDAVWQDWDAILAAHPNSDLFERLEDPANDLILAAAWAKSSPHALALIEKSPALLTDPTAIEAAIVEAKKLFKSTTAGTPPPRGNLPTPSSHPNERTMPMPSLPPGASARDRWIAQADQARSKMHDAHARGDTRKAELWSAEEHRLLSLAYARAV